MKSTNVTTIKENMVSAKNKVVNFFKEVWAETKAQQANEDKIVEKIIDRTFEFLERLSLVISKILLFASDCVRGLFNLAWKLAIIWIAIMLFKMNYPVEYAFASAHVMEFLNSMCDAFVSAYNDIATNGIFRFF